MLFVCSLFVCHVCVFFFVWNFMYLQIGIHWRSNIMSLFLAANFPIRKESWNKWWTLNFNVRSSIFYDKKKTNLQKNTHTTTFLTFTHFYSLGTERNDEEKKILDFFFCFTSLLFRLKFSVQPPFLFHSLWYFKTHFTFCVFHSFCLGLNLTFCSHINSYVGQYYGQKKKNECAYQNVCTSVFYDSFFCHC